LSPPSGFSSHAAHIARAPSHHDAAPASRPRASARRHREKKRARSRAAVRNSKDVRAVRGKLVRACTIINIRVSRLDRRFARATLNAYGFELLPECRRHS